MHKDTSGENKFDITMSSYESSFITNNVPNYVTGRERRVGNLFMNEQHRIGFESATQERAERAMVNLLPGSRVDSIVRESVDVVRQQLEHSIYAQECWINEKRQLASDTFRAIHERQQNNNHNIVDETGEEELVDVGTWDNFHIISRETGIIMCPPCEEKTSMHEENTMNTPVEIKNGSIDAASMLMPQNILLHHLKQDTSDDLQQKKYVRPKKKKTYEMRSCAWRMFCKDNDVRVCGGWTKSQCKYGSRLKKMVPADVLAKIAKSENKKKQSETMRRLRQDRKHANKIRNR